ncbi:hypothetical protein ACF0H5_019559 [Mactra antiquata]
MSIRSSTPISTDIKTPRAGKRPRSAIGSDSSVDAELSYLDLDTGKVLSASKSKPSDRLVLSTSEYDSIMSKMSLFEKSVSKLDKLDKLDNTENNVTKLVSKISNIETRLNINEKATSELQTSVTFLSSKYDDFVAQSKTDSAKLSECSSKVQTITSENEELRNIITEMDELNKSLKDDLIDLKCRSMRDNLVFTNIPERVHDDNGRHYEDT